MANTGFFDFIDDKLEEAYQYVAPDNSRHRRPFIKALERAAETFKEGREQRGEAAMWSISNGVVRFIPKLNATWVPLKEGKPVFYLAKDKFADAIAGLIKEVEAGDHDAALVAAYDSRGKKTDKPAERRGGERVRAAWTPERRAKFEASIAAKQGNKVD